MGAVDFCAHMAKSRKHRHEIKKPQSQTYETLRNIHFAKEHNNKGLKKIQVNHAKVMNAHAKAIKALSLSPRKSSPRS